MMMFRREAAAVGAFYRDIAGADIANSNGRIIPFVFSTEEVARDMHTILTRGILHRNFDSNPVFNWAHDTSQPPIGRVSDLRVQGTKLVGDVEYATADEYQFADTIFRLVKGGFINATSISWTPLEWKYTSDKSRPGGIDFTKVDLLEISQVPVPALPAALATARSQGIDTQPIYEWSERALDMGTSMLPRSELEILRREAKMPSAARRGETIVMPGRRGKFRDIAEFARAAIDATTGVKADSRLVRAPSGLTIGDPTKGGFLVEGEISQDIITSVYAGASPIAGYCDRRETAKPLGKIDLPGIDETSRADGFRNGGVLGFWTTEGTQVTGGFPRWKKISLEGNKLEVLVFLTGELLADAPMLRAHLNKVVANEFAFLLDLKIIAGAGAGVPLGIINASCTITLPKVAGQSAGTIVKENLDGMWDRLPAPSRRRMIWIGNEDCEGQLNQLNQAVGTGGQLVYRPPNAVSDGSAYASLYGRPLVIVEQCPVLGQPGDIIAADLSEYIISDGGVQEALSMEVFFLSDQPVLKFVWRVDGRPAFATPVASYNGGATRSPFVTLAAR